MIRAYAVQASRFAAVAACVATPFLAALAQSNQSGNTRALAADLSRQSDPDSLATAALLYDSIDSHADALEHARRAARLAPDRTDLAWLELQLCVRSPACPADKPARRLQVLDPQNGAAFLYDLPGAPDAGAADVTAALLRISQAERFDSYWANLLVMVHDVLARSEHVMREGDSRRSAAIEAAGLVAAFGLPSLAQLSAACRGEAIEDSTRRDLCLRVARAMERGDTLLAEAVGLAMERRLWPTDSREGAIVEARRRQLRQRQDALSHIEAGMEWEERFIAALRAHRNERDAADALLAQYRDIGHASAAARNLSTLGAAATDAADSDAAFDPAAAATHDNVQWRTRMSIELLNVSFLAVAVAALSSFLLGGLWYSRALFGATWSREAGINPETKQGHRPMVFVTSYLLAFLAAWLFAALLPAEITVAQSTVLGALIGVAWVATSFGINYGFGDRSLTLWLIDAGYHTLQFTLFGAIIGAWR